MGGKTGNVTRLPLQEPARLDPVRVLKLRRELGHAGAVAVMERRLEGLATALARMEAQRGAEEGDFAAAGARLTRIATDLGLMRLAQVAEDAVEALEIGDEIAAAAVWARLLRLCGSALGTAADAREGRA